MDLEKVIHFPRRKDTKNLIKKKANGIKTNGCRGKVLVLYDKDGKCGYEDSSNFSPFFGEETVKYIFKKKK